MKLSELIAALGQMYLQSGDDTFVAIDYKYDDYAAVVEFRVTMNVETVYDISAKELIAPIITGMGRKL